MTYQSPQGPYQPPYPPPMGFDYYAPQQVDPLAPARRASNTMYVLGALMLLLGTCTGITLANLEALMRMPDVARMSQQTPEFTEQRMKRELTVSTAVLLPLGLTSILLAVFVRRGGNKSIVAALVLSSLVLLFLVKDVVIVLIRGEAAPPAAVGMTLCILFVPLALFLTQLIFLIQAARNVGQVKALRAQYAQQYWQYAYQQQMYQQPGVPPPQQTPPPPSQGPSQPRG